MERKIYRNKLHECPCHDCICVPICKQRWFQPMLRQCEKIRDYLYNETTTNGEDYYDRMQVTRVALFKELYI
jgi:hypothetical protein